MNDRADEIRSARAPKLREDQIEVLRRYGKTRKAEAGEVLFRAGDASNDFIVVLEGEVEVVDDFAGEARTMGVHRSGCRGSFVGCEDATPPLLQPAQHPLGRLDQGLPPERPPAPL
jgi:Cyclic nucleotide-binding domain